MHENKEKKIKPISLKFHDDEIILSKDEEILQSQSNSKKMTKQMVKNLEDIKEDVPDHEHTKPSGSMEDQLYLEENSSKENHLNSSKWKKVQNLLRSVHCFQNYNTKNISNDCDFDNDMSDYKNRLLQNTLKSKNSKINSDQKETERLNINKSNDANKNKNNGEIDSFGEIQNLFIEAITNDKINGDKRNKEIIKENIEYYIINDFESRSLVIIDEIYKYNPDRNIKSESDDSFIFNTPLKSNGKTLIYLACQEGKEEILIYFLNKGLNAKIPSIIDGNNETPLECACRWGYLKIVQILLNRVSYTKKEIKKCLKINGISESIVEKLNEKLDELGANTTCC